MKRKFPEQAGNLLLKALAMTNPAFAAHFAELEAREAWNALLSEKGLLAYTQNFQFANGAIRVRITSPALRNELFMQRAQLIEKLNAKIGRQLVMAIVFV